MRGNVKIFFGEVRNKNSADRFCPCFEIFSNNYLHLDFLSDVHIVSGP